MRISENCSCILSSSYIKGELFQVSCPPPFLALSWSVFLFLFVCLSYCFSVLRFFCLRFSVFFMFVCFSFCLSASFSPAIAILWTVFPCLNRILVKDVYFEEFSIFQQQLSKNNGFTKNGISSRRLIT